MHFPIINARQRDLFKRLRGTSAKRPDFPAGTLAVVDPATQDPVLRDDIKEMERFLKDDLRLPEKTIRDIMREYGYEPLGRKEPFNKLGPQYME